MTALLSDAAGYRPDSLYRLEAECLETIQQKKTGALGRRPIGRLPNAPKTLNAVPKIALPLVLRKASNLVPGELESPHRASSSAPRFELPLLPCQPPMEVVPL
jgi:hypothetical protein